MLVCFAHVLYIANQRPYNGTHEVFLSQVSSSQIFLTLLMGIVLKAYNVVEGERAFIEVMLILMVVATLVLGVVVLWITSKVLLTYNTHGITMTLRLNNHYLLNYSHI